DDDATARAAVREAVRPVARDHAAIEHEPRARRLSFIVNHDGRGARGAPWVEALRAVATDARADERDRAAGGRADRGAVAGVAAPVAAAVRGVVLDVDGVEHQRTVAAHLDRARAGGAACAVAADVTA